MTNVTESKFTFFPRPEAHAMNWSELLPPVQRAVRDLLLRIEGATFKKKSNNDVAANCFLVYGDRGSGKTTVLLSAKKACSKEKHEEFFGEDRTVSDLEKTDAQKVRDNAKSSASELGDVIWLDILDLEPLPLKANLLTTVLTRVRNALYPTDTDGKSSEMTSIFEEGVESAHQKLNHLINDATLMWEDIDEPDTRSRANRQVAAADTYARFQKGFKKAMEVLTSELARRNGKSGEHLHIVLPIDNIDRSTEHLYSIVKLAQMVFCHRLWLVMAGDRQDVETFLERAYWKELIRVGEGAGATGKTGLRGEDEALVMARRQAAAASHKLLPPSHRVEVQLVDAFDTLNYSGISKDHSIRKLLEKVSISEEEPESNKNFFNLKLIHLFDTRTLIGKDAIFELGQEILSDSSRFYLKEILKAKSINKEKKNRFDEILRSLLEHESLTAEDRDLVDNVLKLNEFFENDIGKLNKLANRLLGETYLTEAAQLGLRLPARGVIDLWQLAYWITHDDTIKSYRKAEKIARTMLRNVITESNLSSEAGRCLQEQIIVRNPQGGTMLNFSDPNAPEEMAYRKLDIRRLTSVDFAIRILQEQLEYNEDSSQSSKEVSQNQQSSIICYLSVMQTKTITTRLSLTQQGELYTIRKPRDSQLEDSSAQKERHKINYDVMPDLVTAWLVILYDILMWGSEDSAAIDAPEIPQTIDVGYHFWPDPDRTGMKIWQLPRWKSFIIFDVCRQYWLDFIDELTGHNDGNKKGSFFNIAAESGLLPRLLSAGWVACILQTYSQFMPPGAREDNVLQIVKDKMALCNVKECRLVDVKKNISEADILVMGAAARIYDKIMESNPGDVFKYDGKTTDMIDWLEVEWFRQYVPLNKDELNTRSEDIYNILVDTNLGKFLQTYL